MLRDRRLGSAMLLIPLELTILVSMALAAAPAALDLDANAESSSSPRLNELLPWPIAGEREWVDLINSSSAPIAMTGWYVEGMRGPTWIPCVSEMGSWLPASSSGIHTGDPE